MSLTALVWLVIAVAVFVGVAAFVIWAAKKLMTVWGVKEPWFTTVYVILVLLLLLVALSYWGVIPSGYFHR